MNRLQQLQQETNRALVALAKQHPLELVEKPRFQTLSEEKPEIATALTRAFIMAKSEKPPVQPAEISDQAKALPKPRIPTPPKK